jgi:hypothetical protein
MLADLGRGRVGPVPALSFLPRLAHAFLVRFSLSQLGHTFRRSERYIVFLMRLSLSQLTVTIGTAKRYIISHAVFAIAK